jgi:cytochrome c-type biogenesis protein CcmH/NrfG
MSLLLQALQKAAKNRESTAPAAPAEAPSRPLQPGPVEIVMPSSFSVEPAVEEPPKERELSLEEEDLFEPEQLSISPATEHAAERFEPFAAPGASSAQASSILRATGTPTAGWVDWVRDHPVHTFAGAAGVFAVFYTIYLCLQLFYPGVLRGDFLSKPLTAQTPPPPPQAITPPPPPPAEAAAPATAQAPTPATATTGTPAGLSPAPGAMQPAGGPITGMPTASPAPSGTSATKPLQTRPAQPVTAASPDQPTPRSGMASRRARKAAEASAANSTVEDHLASKPAVAGGVPVSLGIAQAYQALQQGNLDQAEALYREAVQSDPQNLDAMLGLATIAAQRGNAQQAIGFYERALELEPRNPVAQAGLISIIGQADPHMSEARLKQLIAREPSAFLYFNLGNLYARQDLWAAAQGAYFQSYQLQPDNPDYAYNLAIGLEHLNQPKLALTYYRKALDLSFQKGHANFDQNRVIERIGQLSARVD